MEFCDILIHIHFLYNGEHYAPIECFPHLFNLIFMMLRFYLSITYAFSVYFTRLHLKSHLTAGFCKDGQRKKPIYIPKTSPAHAASAFYMLIICFTFYSCGMTLSLLSLFNACLFCELD